MATQAEIREQVTSRIVEVLKAGTAPWRRPWSNLVNTGSPANVVSSRNYSGINALILPLVSAERNWTSRWFGTFRQWTGLGFRIKPRPSGVFPGHWGTQVVFCKAVRKKPIHEKSDEDQHDEADERPGNYLLLRQFYVFNAEQVEGDGIERFLAQPRTTATFTDYEPAEQVIAATKAVIRHAGSRAFYQPDGDFIQMPPKDAFESQVAYYGTLAHETCHWSGHESRLNRIVKNARFGDAAYAFEELVAEIGGCFLCSEVGLPQSDDLSNQAAYLASWLRILKADPSAIFSAASQASAAVEYILSFSRKEEGASEEDEAAELAQMISRQNA